MRVASGFACLLTCALATPAIAREARWTLRVAPALGLFAPAASYRPIGAGTDVQLGTRIVLNRTGLPFGLRFAFSVGGNSRSFPDTTVRYADGAAWPYGAADVGVGTTVDWFTLGVEWDPHSARAGAYGFIGAGTVNTSSEVSVLPDELVIPNPPALPPPSAAACAIAGGGWHQPIPWHDAFAAYAEVEYRYGGRVRYVGTPESSGYLSDTMFPERRTSVSGWAASVGVSYAIRWGRAAPVR